MDNSKKQNEKQRLKKLIKAVMIVFIALLIILGALYLFSQLLKSDKVDYTKREESIYYFSADYNANPLDDLVYVSKNREIMFIDRAGNGELLTEKDKDTKTEKALFYNYFTALMEGEATSHSALLTENYKSNFAVQERFTPQKIYDIDIRFLTGDTEDGKYSEKYQVSYKIYENDGSYRADVGSNIAMLMVFEVTTENGRAMINSIVPMNMK